jgi:DmsE family decaheme c-type cytochrome
MDRPFLAACAGAIALAAALAVAVPARSDEDPWSEASLRARFPDPDAGVAAEKYAEGNADCKECHDDRVKSLSKSFHAKLAGAQPAGSRGCQECHGPGKAHADDDAAPIRDPYFTADFPAWMKPAAKPPKEGETPHAHVAVSVKEMNGACLRCHEDVLASPRLGHREWLARTRDPSGERSCVSCHLVHLDKGKPAFDKTVGPFATAADLAKVATPEDPARCIGCHTEYHPQMARSGHAFLMKDGAEHGCAACHGPGSLHAQSGGDARKIIMPAKERAADLDASCNECHLKGKSVEKWTCAEHSRQRISCIVCHDPNAPKGHTLRAPEGVMREDFEKSPEFHLCGKCHLDVQAQLRMPNRHRVEEGRVSCSDCHDPHGNTDKVRDRDVRYTACAKCHQEKAGPLLYDHGIKRTEGCTACHDPHGSSNRRMLTYAQMKPMCLQCHPDLPNDHDLAKQKYANCLSCHTQIHGSDLDRYFLR